MRIEELVRKGVEKKSLEDLLPKKRIRREGSVDTGATPFAMQSQPANHELSGYMPGRLEFEVEYENEAESIVKDMVFVEEDTIFDIGTFNLERLTLCQHC